MKKKCFAALVIAACSASEANAGPAGYVCTIAAIQELGMTGTFALHGGAFANLVGKTFSIDRRTGQVVGLPFTTGPNMEIRILDRGSDVDSYKQLIVLPPPNVWVRYIYVREQIKPDRKPFWATDYGNLIYSGTCE
ncbi:MAG: hypothetical protein NTW45_02855 [Rhodocyclales bacterium]|nr:hypothetical protein [Rhodocyclales bacterium]